MANLSVLFGVGIIVGLVICSAAIPVKDEKFLEKIESCKDLCGYCGCIGFYCGDECLCECSDQNNKGKFSLRSDNHIFCKY